MLAQLMIRKCKSAAGEIGLAVISEYNGHMPNSIKRRVLRAGSLHALKRVMKLIPVAGSIFALGLAGYEIKKKGLIPGVCPRRPGRDSSSGHDEKCYRDLCRRSDSG